MEPVAPIYEPVALVLDFAQQLLLRKRRKAWLLRAATQDIMYGRPITGRALRA